MNTFDTAFRILLTLEGGASAHPADRGGLTRYGISQAAYPHLNIAALTEREAFDIYENDYWLPAGCPQLPQRVAIALFDASVHHGIHRAVQQLQAVVGAKADGLMGPRTRAAVRQLARTPDAEKQLLMQLLAQRALFLHSIVVSTPSQQVFHLGWLRRLFLLQQALLAFTPQA